MKLPDYVSKKEVQRVCKELGFRDWSTLKEVSVLQNESSEILRIVNVKGMDIPIDDFKQGLEVELEHGLGGLARQRNRGAWQARDLGSFEGDARRLQRGDDLIEGVDGGSDLERVAFVLDVVRAGLEGDLHQLVLGGAGL